MLSKDNFIFVRYNGVPYPPEYHAPIQEMAAHLDQVQIERAQRYSLHTEYSYGKRRLDSLRVICYPTLCAAHKDGVPQLWKSEAWADEFAAFLIGMTRIHTPPELIEIHPPFDDYCDLEAFAQRYRVFERRIHAAYPDTAILLENRSGTTYRGGKFLVGTAQEIASLCALIRRYDLQLGVVLDFPQLLTAEKIDTLKFKAEKYQAAIDMLIPDRDRIKGIHIWGKKKSAAGRWVAHAGNLDTYFGGNREAKALFIAGIEQICGTGTKRFFVPEVNTGAEDLKAVLQALFSDAP